jgi:hypothetical protein
MLWIGFANGVASRIIADAYNEQSLSVLNWAFQGHRSLPVGHYLDRWSDITAAVLIATIMHLVIVLFIAGSDRKHGLLIGKNSRADSHTNFVLIAFSAAFLALTALSLTHGDYRAYLSQWVAVLGGRDPWLFETSLAYRNAYGPLFNVLAPLVWFGLFANKLLFAFAYVAYVIWLVKEFAPRRKLVALSWPWLSFWLLNPFPWVEIAYFGYFDVLVALACVAAVHNVIARKDGVSGTYLASGILLKYMPIVILPFLVFSERRLHIRLLSLCLGVVAFGLVVSVLIWGTSTFSPLTLAATRHSHWSIYDALAETQSLRLLWSSSNSDPLVWLERPFVVTAGLGVFLWCMLRRTGPALSAALAILATLLFYRVGYINYQMVPFLLILYWVCSEWQELIEHSVLVALVGGYFGLLAIFELAHWSEFTLDMPYSNVVMFKFFLGLAVLIGLIQFSARRRYV